MHENKLNDESNFPKERIQLLNLLSQKPKQDQVICKILDSGLQDIWTHETLQQNMGHYLKSKHNNLDVILHKIISMKHYQSIVRQFLASVLQETYLPLSNKLEKHIIMHIWTPNYRYHSPNSIMNYLCMKMRSLDPNIKLCALVSFRSMLQYLLNTDQYESQNIDSISMLTIVRNKASSMIEKQLLLKVVDYVQGVFLQLLQDELHQVRINTMRCLCLLKSEINPRDMKPLILSMLNDEHHKVRQYTLECIVSLEPFTVSSIDVNTLLMYLKDQNHMVRYQTYQCLQHINLSDDEAFSIMLNCILQNLQIYKTDKKEIYGLCFNLAVKYTQNIRKNISQIYPYNNDQQPNWKGLVYKARVIILKEIDDTSKLPYYFNTHADYIRDVEYYLWKNDNSIQIQHSQLQLHNITNRNSLLQLISSEMSINTGIITQLLLIIHDLLKQIQNLPNIRNTLTKIDIMNTFKNQNEVLNKILQLSISYDNFNTQQLLQKTQLVFTRIINIQYTPNTFRVNRYQQDCFIVTNKINFRNSCVVKYTKKERYCNAKNTIQYVNISSLQAYNEDQKYVYYRLKLKASKIECLLVCWEGAEPIITDTYDFK